MYLKSLELQGFKSFPDKTKLTFGEGTTVIVGPNGSGKSNLSDAMRWVLGEMSSKTLRGSKMEDFIFAGAAGRRPMGFAEVSVTFDNTSETDRLACPYDEVKVTRRYYRSGDSEYALNGQPARLKDIYELFMDTGVGRDGYSIIGQGRIGELISKKSDERRGVFEEAAGIAKYRFRKNEAERKLKSTEDNMVRIMDVFGEVEAQVEPLGKEAERAKKAIELMAEKKELDVRLWLYDTEKQRTAVAEAEANFRHSEFDLKNAEEAQEALEQQNERLLELSRSSKSIAEDLLRRIREHTASVHSLESEYRVTETGIRHTEVLLENSKATLRTLIAEIAAEEQKRVDRAQHTEILKKKRTAELSRKAELESERDKAKAEANRAATALGELLEALNETEAAVADAKLRLSILENAQKSGSDRKKAIRGEINDYRTAISALVTQYEAIEKKVNGFNALLRDAKSTVEASESTLASLAQKKERTLSIQNAARYESGSIEQRIRTIRTMEEQFEGYSGSVRFIMKRYAEGQITLRNGAPCGTIYGPLSKIITVDDQFVTAVETALGANLGHIVTEDEETAKAAMFALKQAKAGRATFFPVTSMQAYAETPDMARGKTAEGFIAVGSELCRCDERFRNIISNLLGRILIFDNIEHASEAAKLCRYKVKIVTLDGQVINAGGSFTGGSTRSEGTILGRAAEIRRLEAELLEKQKRVDAITADLQAIDREIGTATAARNSASDKTKVVEMLLNAELRRKEQTEAEKNAQATLLQKLEEDLLSIETQHTRAEEDSISISAELKALTERAGEIRALRSEKDVEQNEALDRRASLDEALIAETLTLHDTEREIEADRQRDIEAEERIAAETVRKAAEEEKIASHLASIADMKRRIDENRAECRKVQSELDRLNTEYAGNSSDSAEYENRLSEIAARIRRKSEEKETLVRVHLKNETRLQSLRDEQDKLNSQLWDEYEMTRADAVALGYPPLEQEERASAFTLRNSCRAKLRAMGSVDLDAVEKYRELKERYDKMKTQITDLQKTKNELLRILDDLTDEMKDAFETSFREINTHFKRIFAELFGGGQAEISLSEPDNPLESGIEIKAAPPGKIVKNLLQLSGGEQAFTAVALLFAILSVNPTPFCILDEIEAALDEANVERFAQYVKRYEGTQFIIITHRRGTMEAADNLYGVTMPEQGMSQVLRLSTEEIERYKEDTPA